MSESHGTERRSELEDARLAARADLTATVEELAAFFSPKTQTSRAMARGRRLVHDATSPSAVAEDRRRARVVLAVAAGVTAATVAGLVGRLRRR